MMYDTDCMASIVQLLAADSKSIRRRTYNVTGFSFTPEEIADAIRRVVPTFEINYKICPMRQAIGNLFSDLAELQRKKTSSQNYLNHKNF